MRSLWHLIRFGTFVHDFHRGRDEDGKAVHCCSLCGYQQAIFADKVIIRPAHHQVSDLGAVRTSAQYPDRKQKVVDFRESQR